MVSALLSPSITTPTASYFGTLSELWLVDARAIQIPAVHWDSERLPQPIPTSLLFTQVPFFPESATLTISPVDGPHGRGHAAEITYRTLNVSEATQEALESWAGRRLFALCKPAGDGLIWAATPLVVSYAFSQGDTYTKSPHFAVTLRPEGKVSKQYYAGEWQNPNSNRHAFNEGFNQGFS